MSYDVVEVPSVRYPHLLLRFTSAGGARVQWHIYQIERVPTGISEGDTWENKVWVAGGTSRNARKATFDAESAARRHVADQAKKAAAMHDLRRELGLP